MRIINELLAYLAGKPLTLAQECLAHYQAEELVHEMSWKFEFCFNKPYHDFTSTSLLEVGDSIARDFRPGEENGFLTVFPLRLRKAKKDDKVIGTVLQVWKGSHECGGLYLETKPHIKILKENQ